MSGRLRRGAWFALGWVAVGLGTIGVVVPGLPTTVFFVIAAGCFSRSSPRFEQWVLTRPGVGPLVRDYRAGLGMPRRAKIAATLSIGFVVSLSAFLAVDAWWLRIVLLAVGAVGIGWILGRIPTRARPAAATWPAISHWFGAAAAAETATWLALIVGMAVKYLGSGADTGVAVFGLVHGVVVLVYVAVAVLAAPRLGWGARTLLTALLASVPPLGTFWFEAWAERHGRLASPRPGDGLQYGAPMTDAQKPSVTIPDGDPPNELATEDLTVGDGDEATAGCSVSVHYVGVAWSDGQQFDASWDRGDTFDFRLGTGEVIQGWDRGVAGMKVGGRRRITIPPELGYGSRGAAGAIKGGETLVFVVDLLGVT